MSFSRLLQRNMMMMEMALICQHYGKAFSKTSFRSNYDKYHGKLFVLNRDWHAVKAELPLFRLQAFHILNFTES